MNNKIFLDSSVLVEFLKNTKADLLKDLLRAKKFELLISSEVVSEILYHSLAIYSGKAPLMVQMRQEINTIFTEYPSAAFLKRFDFLPSNAEIVELAPQLMQEYNLLSNDALILATCKIHQISILASYDPDFEPACQGEQIQLVQIFNQIPT
jgi:predicted nucleic acid-binding protein